MKNLTTIPCFLLAIACHAQTLPINLSQNLNKTFTQSIEPQEIKEVLLTNAIIVLGTQYEVKVIKEKIKTVPFNVTNLSAVGACDTVIDAVSALKAKENESAIPNAIDAVKDAIKALNGDSACAKSINDANEAIESTVNTIKLAKPIKIEKGEKVTVTVTRGNDNKWIYVFETEKEDRWKIYYGFSYVLPAGLTSFKNFYAKSDTGSTFLITKSNQSQKFQLKNITPTIMYSYMFTKKESCPVKFALSGGFVIDLTNPSAVFAPSLIIGDNISLNLGIAITQKSTLKGQYSEGQRIKENLDFDQLHDKPWTYDAFFSIGFRFDKNPFKKDEPKKEATEVE